MAITMDGPSSTVRILFMMLVVVSGHTDTILKTLQRDVSPELSPTAVRDIRVPYAAETHGQMRSSLLTRSTGAAVISNVNDDCKYPHANSSDLFAQSFSKMTLDDRRVLLGCRELQTTMCDQYVSAFVFKGNPTIYPATNPVRAMCCRTCSYLRQEEVQRKIGMQQKVSDVCHNDTSRHDLLNSKALHSYKALLDDGEYVLNCTEVTRSKCNERTVKTLELKDVYSNIYGRAGGNRAIKGSPPLRALCCLTCGAADAIR